MCQYIVWLSWCSEAHNLFKCSNFINAISILQILSLLPINYFLRSELKLRMSDEILLRATRSVYSTSLDLKIFRATASSNSASTMRMRAFTIISINTSSSLNRKNTWEKEFSGRTLNSSITLNVSTYSVRNPPDYSTYWMRSAGNCIWMNFENE